MAADGKKAGVFDTGMMGWLILNTARTQPVYQVLECNAAPTTCVAVLLASVVQLYFLAICRYQLATGMTAVYLVQNAGHLVIIKRVIRKAGLCLQENKKARSRYTKVSV